MLMPILMDLSLEGTYGTYLVLQHSPYIDHQKEEYWITKLTYHSPQIGTLLEITPISTISKHIN